MSGFCCRKKRKLIDIWLNCSNPEFQRFIYESNEWSIDNKKRRENNIDNNKNDVNQPLASEKNYATLLSFWQQGDYVSPEKYHFHFVEDGVTNPFSLCSSLTDLKYHLICYRYNPKGYISLLVRALYLAPNWRKYRPWPPSLEVLDSQYTSTLTMILMIQKAENIIHQEELINLIGDTKIGLENKINNCHDYVPDPLFFKYNSFTERIHRIILFGSCLHNTTTTDWKYPELIKIINWLGIRESIKNIVTNANCKLASKLFKEDHSINHQVSLIPRNADSFFSNWMNEVLKEGVEEESYSSLLNAVPYLISFGKLDIAITIIKILIMKHSFFDPLISLSKLFKTTVDTLREDMNILIQRFEMMAKQMYDPASQIYSLKQNVRPMFFFGDPHCNQKYDFATILNVILNKNKNKQHTDNIEVSFARVFQFLSSILSREVPPTNCFSFIGDDDSFTNYYDVLLGLAITFPLSTLNDPGLEMFQNINDNKKAPYFRIRSPGPEEWIYSVCLRINTFINQGEKYLNYNVSTLPNTIFYAVQKILEIFLMRSLITSIEQDHSKYINPANLKLLDALDRDSLSELKGKQGTSNIGVMTREGWSTERCISLQPLENGIVQLPKDSKYPSIVEILTDIIQNGSYCPYTGTCELLGRRLLNNYENKDSENEELNVFESWITSYLMTTELNCLSALTEEAETQTNPTNLKDRQSDGAMVATMYHSKLVPNLSKASQDLNRSLGNEFPAAICFSGFLLACNVFGESNYINWIDDYIDIRQIVQTVNRSRSLWNYAKAVGDLQDPCNFIFAPEVHIAALIDIPAHIMTLYSTMDGHEDIASWMKLMIDIRLEILQCSIEARGNNKMEEISFINDEADDTKNLFLFQTNGESEQKSDPDHNVLLSFQRKLGLNEPLTKNYDEHILPRPFSANNHTNRSFRKGYKNNENEFLTPKRDLTGCPILDDEHTHNNDGHALCIDDEEERYYNDSSGDIDDDSIEYEKDNIPELYNTKELADELCFFTKKKGIIIQETTIQAFMQTL